MRVQRWLPILAFAASGFASGAQLKQSNATAPISMSGANASPIGRSHQAMSGVNARAIQRSQHGKAFADLVQEYVTMHKDLESSGSPAARNSTNDSEQIADRQHALAGRIAAARRGSRQGDIFTHDVAEEFEKPGQETSLLPFPFPT